MDRGGVAGRERRVLRRTRRPAGRQQQHGGDEDTGDDDGAGGHEQELGVRRVAGHGRRCTTQVRESPVCGRSCASTTIPLRGSLRIPRQATVRALRHPRVRRCARHHGARGGGGGRPHRLPGRREGPGPGGRPRQGRRHQARRQRRGGAHARREHPRHGHQGPRGEGGLDRDGERHRRGVLRLLHPRPGGQAPPRHALGPGWGGDRAGGGGEPRRHRQDPRRPGRRAHRGAVPRVGGGGEAQPRRPPRARSTS